MPEASIAEAKTQLTRLISQAELGEAVHITRRGKPVAVLLSESEYARLRQRETHRSFWELIVEMRDDPPNHRLYVPSNGGALVTASPSYLTADSLCSIRPQFPAWHC